MDRAAAIIAKREKEAATGREWRIGYNEKGDSFYVFEVRKRMPEPFVVMFPGRLSKLLERYPLSGVENRLLVALLEHHTRSAAMIFTQMSYRGVAQGMGITRQQMQKALKKFREMGVLIADGEDGELFNPLLYYRGSAKDLEGCHRDLYERGKAVFSLALRGGEVGEE